MILAVDQLELLKSLYPRRKGGQGWADTARLVAQHLRQGHDWEAILAGTRAYRDFCDREGLTGTEYVKQAATFYGRGCWWAEDYSEPSKPRLPSEISLERRWQALQQRADAIGFRNPTPLERAVDPSVYEFQLKGAEASSNVRGIR